jgi:hypothetical protein
VSSARRAILQARMDNAPHSAVHKASAGDSMWGSSRVDLLEETPLEARIRTTPVCPIVDLILRKEGLDG